LGNVFSFICSTISADVAIACFFSLALMEVKWYDHGSLASNMKNTLNILVSSSLEGLSLAQFAQFIHWYSTFAFAGSFFKILFFFPVLAFGLIFHY
jgi:hypothetical protein